jgi:hypothetical protein
VISVVKVVEDFNRELVEDSNRAILIVRIRLLLSRILIYSKEPKRLYQLYPPPARSYKSLTETDIYRRIKVDLGIVVITNTSLTNSVFISEQRQVMRNLNSKNRRVVIPSIASL